jgi:hypothetical protein
LAECLVALLLLGFAVLMAASAVTGMTSVARRVESQGELLAAVENVLEAARAGAVPLQSGPVPGASLQGMELDDFRAVLEVEPAAVAGLYRVAVHGTCSCGQDTLERHLVTMVWRP